MKIATKTGDSGTTSLLYGTRVAKSDYRIEMVGVIDELSSYLGLSKLETREFLSHKSLYLSVEDCPVAYDVAGYLEDVQKLLITIMGEVVCESDKIERYAKSFPVLTLKNLEELERRVSVFEDDESLVPADWVIYGHNRVSTHFDISSKICRRAERVLWTHVLARRLDNMELTMKYFNRLSDYLYLCARFFEKNWVG